MISLAYRTAFERFQGGRAGQIYLIYLQFIDSGGSRYGPKHEHIQIMRVLNIYRQMSMSMRIENFLQEQTLELSTHIYRSRIK